MKHVTALLLLSLASAWSWAAGITVGAPPPDLQITDRGELVMSGDDFDFAAWQLPAAMGKVHVVQYMAGRMSARGQTKPFTDRLETELPDRGFHVTTVINLDDAIWGSTSFVMREVKSNKRKYPDSTIVLDSKGVGLSTWKLQPKGAAVVVLDPGGSVLFFKEGAMSDAEIDSTLDLMRQYIALPAAS